MRKLIVSNFVSLDGYYESNDKSFDDFFDYYHPDYAGDDQFDHYNTERLRAADTLILSGRNSFLGNKDYWTSVPYNPQASAIRKEFARLIQQVEKLVISNTIIATDLAPWDNTRIVKVADAAKEIAALKEQSGREILILMGRMLWNSLLEHQLIDDFT
ncbi:MAG: dihydrofolate reductase family protein [Deinococcales bacterium]